MSFFVERKKVFLLFFLFIFIFSPLLTSAQASVTGGAGTGSQQQGKDTTLAKSIESLGIGTLGMAVVGPFLAVTGVLVFALSLIVLGLASFGLDFAIDIGIYGISDFANSQAIKDVWAIFRNLANVAIVFILVFIAMATILGISGYEGKKLLGRVILAAVLLNFSFLFGAIVVDVSNQMSITIYKEIASNTNINSVTSDGGSSGGGGQDQKLKLGSYYFEITGVATYMALAQDVDASTKKVADTTWSKAFNAGKGALVGMQAGGLTGAALGAIGGANANELKTNVNKSIIIAVTTIMSAINNLILAVILFVGSFMIYGRLIAILLLLVVSPIAFVSMILPNTQKISKEWWGSIVGQSFFLPVFLMFIYIGIKISEQVPDVVKKIAQNQAENSSGSGQDWFGLIKELSIGSIIFIITMGLFIAALTVAKKMASQGNAAVGKLSASVSSGLTAGFGGAALGTAAWAGRRSIGGLAEVTANSKFGQAIGSTRIGSYALQGMKGVAKSSFDARNSRVFKGIASATGIGDNGFGKAGGDKGFVGMKEAAEKRRIDRAGNLNKELSPEQALELDRKTNDMDTILDTDPGVAQEKKNISDLKKDIKREQKLGNVGTVAALKSQLNSSQRALFIEEKRVKQTQAYLAAQKEVEKSMSAQAKYGTALSKSKWMPSSSADRSAAKKILKEKSDTDKMIEALKANK